MQFLTSKQTLRNAEVNQLQKDLAALEDDHQRRHVIITLAMLAPMFFTFASSGKGIFEKFIEAGVANLTGMITSGMAAAVSATLLGTSVILIFGLAMNAGKTHRWPLMALTSVLAVFIVFLSTYFSISGVTGATSVAYHMKDTVTGYAAYLDDTFAQASAARNSKAILTPQTHNACAKAKHEKKGLGTGAPGKGLAYFALSSRCTSLQSILGTLDDTIQRTEDRQAEAETRLTVLHGISNDSNTSLFARKEKFVLEQTALDKLVAASDAENIRTLLQAQIKTMRGDVAKIEGQKSSLHRKQAHILEALKQSLVITEEALKEFLQEDMTRPAKPIPLMDMDQAMWAYWQRNIPLIMLAIAVDFMALFYACTLMVSRSMMEQKRSELLNASQSATSASTHTNPFPKQEVSS